MGETSKAFYARRELYWSKKKIPTTFNFDKRVHYPIGSGLADSIKPDIVYRSVPVYTPELRRSLSVAVSTSAAVRRQKQMVDVSASVPKKPHVREMFVDAMTGMQIGEISILIYIFFFITMDVLFFADPYEQATSSTRSTPLSPTLATPLPVSPTISIHPPDSFRIPTNIASPTGRMNSSFQHIRLKTPPRKKFSDEEVKILTSLVITQSPMLSNREDLYALLRTPAFKHDPPRTLESIRTKIRDIKNDLKKRGLIP